MTDPAIPTIALTGAAKAAPMAAQPAQTAGANPYGDATRIDTRERQRLDEQFALHTAPTLTHALRAADEQGNGPAGLTLLDIGPGQGALAGHLAAIGSRPRELRLLEPHAGLLLGAAQRARQAGIATQACQGAIDVQPVPPHLRGNDLVLLSFTLTHVNDLAAAICHAAAAVRPGGLLVVCDVDYQASHVAGDEAAAEVLASIRGRLAVSGLADALPRLALANGLLPADGLGCLDHRQCFSGREGVQQRALGFVANFHPGDAALAPWQRIGDGAHLLMHRLAHVYRATR